MLGRVVQFHDNTQIHPTSMKTKTWISALITPALSLWLVALPCHAALITQWNFNSNPADSGGTHFNTGSTTPSTGSGTAQTIGSTTASFDSAGTHGGSSDPATSDDTAWKIQAFPAATLGNKTAGLEFKVSTIGNANIVVSWDQDSSASSSRFLRFQYSTDGTSFTDFSTAFETGTADVWSQRSIDLSSITAANNNALFAFRLVSEFESTATGAGNVRYAPVGSSYSSAGIWSFDMVTITAVPEPAHLALGLFGIGLLAVSGARTWLRRRHPAPSSAH